MGRSSSVENSERVARFVINSEIRGLSQGAFPAAPANAPIKAGPDRAPKVSLVFRFLKNNNSTPFQKCVFCTIHWHILDHEDCCHKAS